LRGSLWHNRLIPFAISFSYLRLRPSHSRPLPSSLHPDVTPLHPCSPWRGLDVHAHVYPCQYFLPPFCPPNPNPEHATSNRDLFFVVPLAYETWAFPFRCALCSSAKSILIYSDITCDVMFLLDILVSGCCCLCVCLRVTTWQAHAQFVLCNLFAGMLLMSAMSACVVDTAKSDFSSAKPHQTRTSRCIHL